MTDGVDKSNFAGWSFGIRIPSAPRFQSAWRAGKRIADTSRTFGPYIDILLDNDFSLAKDPRSHDKMMRDCHIRSCFRLRQLATASRKVEFLPREDSPQARLIAEKVTQKWSKVRRPTEVLLNILDSIPYGSSFQEIVWKPDSRNMEWYSADILPVHKSKVIFSLDGELCLRTPFDVFYGEKVPDRVFIHHRYDPEGARFEEPETESQLYFGRGEMSNVWPYFLFKTLAMRLGFAYLDRLAFPILVGKYPYRNVEARNEMQTLLSNLNQHKTASWPGDEGWDVDVIQTPATGHNVAMEWITYIDNAISKVILGSTLLQEPGERGSFALGVSHSTTSFGSICEFDSLSLCDTLENTWSKWLCELNGYPVELNPRIVQGSGKLQDISQTVDIMMLLADRGYPVSIEQISETTGIRPARPGETILSLAPDGSIDIRNGEGGPFPKARKPSDFIPPKGSIGGASFPTRPDVYALDIDILPERSVHEDEIERYAVKYTRGMFRTTTKTTVQRKLGPLKEKKIRGIAGEGRRIIFDYTNLRKEDKTYDVEPYSYRYRRGFVYLYAYDPSDRTIKSFFAHKIRNVRKGRKYNPRWIVEITDM